MTKQQGSSTPSSFRNLSVDLGSRHARPALEVLLKMEKRRNRVRSARVFTKNGYIHSSSSAEKNGGNNSAAASIAEIFDLLSRLPNLKYLTVDFHHFLPLQALCFLSQCPRLRELVLEHVQLTGSNPIDDDDDDDEEDDHNASGGGDHHGISSSSDDTNNMVSQISNQVLTNAPALQELSLMNCRGSAALEVLLQQGLPANALKKKLTIVNTPIGTCMESIEVTMAQLGSNPKLSTLRLLDVPNLQDKHVQTLTSFLTNSGGNNNSSKSDSNKSHLIDLEFTSNLLGPIAGQTFVENLHNTKLENLKLHLDWEDCGPAVAKMLRINHRLKTLDLRLYGDDENVREDAILIAKSLQNNSTTALKRLRLCMEMEPGGEDDEVILDEFETTLQTNLQLRYLELDDSIEAFPLPLTLNSKLRLNRSGAPKLWKKNHHATQPQFVQAIINQRDDLNTIYHILREEPTLCCLAAAAPEKVQESSSSETTTTTDCKDLGCSSSDEDYPHPINKPHSSSPPDTTTTTTTTTASFFRSMTTTLSPKSSKRRTTKRFLQRKVRSIFATSA